HSWTKRQPNRDGGAPSWPLLWGPHSNPGTSSGHSRASGNPGPEAESGRDITEIFASKLRCLPRYKIYLALHRSLVYLTIYRNQNGGRHVRHETLWWEVGRRPRLARAIRPRPRLGRTPRRRQYDARRAHAGAGRPALDRARADRGAAAPRL